jgi:hypothetical protein
MSSPSDGVLLQNPAKVRWRRQAIIFIIDARSISPLNFRRGSDEDNLEATKDDSGEAATASFGGS